MRSLGIGLVRLFFGMCHGLRDPEFRAIAFLLALAVAGGSVFYHFTEGWSWVDSLYFSVMSLTTVGDSNLAPTSALGKIFTIGFSLGGISLMLAFVSRLAAYRDSANRD